MSIIAAGTTTTTALSSTGNTDGTLQLQVNGTTPSVTLNTLGAIGVGSTPSFGTAGQVLTSGGSTVAPSWTTVGGGSAATPTTEGTVYGKTNTTNLTFLGYGAGTSNTGTYNTFIGGKDDYYGISAGGSNTSGNTNTAVGSGSIPKNVTGSNITSVGMNAGQNTTAGPNSYFGLGAGSGNTSGTLNVAIGYRTLGYTGAGGIMSNNVCVGDSSLTYNTTGGNNVAVGGSALLSNTTASDNVGIGYQALYSNQTSLNNVAIGYQALYSMASTAVGNNSTAIGKFAGNAATGGGGVYVGYAAGYTCTAANNIYIGTNAGACNSVNATSGSNNVVIGNSVSLAAATNTNSLVLGDNVNGKGSSTGFISSGGGGVYQGNNSSSWSTTSDQRLKKNIADNNDGLDKITSIRVRNFEYRLPEEVDAELKPADAINKTGVQLGVIAQELQAVLPECVKQESTGVLSVDTDNLTWYLINAVKELKAEFDAYKASHP